MFFDGLETRNRIMSEIQNHFQERYEKALDLDVSFEATL
jgi:hypothetical protein